MNEVQNPEAVVGALTTYVESCLGKVRTIQLVEESADGLDGGPPAKKCVSKPVKLLQARDGGRGTVGAIDTGGR